MPAGSFGGQRESVINDRGSEVGDDGSEGRDDGSEASNQKTEAGPVRSDCAALAFRAGFCKAYLDTSKALLDNTS